MEAENVRTRYPTNSLKSPLDFCRPFGGGRRRKKIRVRAGRESEK